MPKVITISCDVCQKDVTSIESPADHYRFCLSSQGIPNKSNFHYAMDFPAPIKSDVYFCSWNCLLDWVKANARVVSANPAGKNESR